MNKNLSFTPPHTSDIPIVHLLYGTYRLWHEVVIKFPKSERYSLGVQCATTLLAMLENILAASANSNKQVKLEKLNVASAKLDLARLLIRLSKDCDCLPNVVYLELQSQLHQAGKMLGGWMKSLSI